MPILSQKHQKLTLLSTSILAFFFRGSFSRNDKNQFIFPIFLFFAFFFAPLKFIAAEGDSLT